MDGAFFYFSLVALVLWVIILTYYLYKITAHYERLITSTRRYNLSSALDVILKNLELNSKAVNEVKKRMIDLEYSSVLHFQKIGIVRFNPFADTGGEQSFIIALLNGKTSGIVLTSIANRGMTRWIVKKVEEGRGVEVQLSSEEEKAIKHAQAIQ